MDGKIIFFVGDHIRWNFPHSIKIARVWRSILCYSLENLSQAKSTSSSRQFEKFRENPKSENGDSNLPPKWTKTTPMGQMHFHFWHEKANLAQTNFGKLPKKQKWHQHRLTFFPKLGFLSCWLCQIGPNGEFQTLFFFSLANFEEIGPCGCAHSQIFPKSWTQSAVVRSFDLDRCDNTVPPRVWVRLWPHLDRVFHPKVVCFLAVLATQDVVAIIKAHKDVEEMPCSTIAFFCKFTICMISIWCTRGFLGRVSRSLTGFIILYCSVFASWLSGCETGDWVFTWAGGCGWGLK